MPLGRISGVEAIANIRSNLFGDWPSRESADTNRIEPLCRPEFSPSFQLEPGEKIFTIGSCFARHIERALVPYGFDVVTSGLAWPDQSIDTMGHDILNNYGVVSIENEFRWALDPDHPFDPERHFFEVAPGRFVDPHLKVRAAPLEKAKAYRTAVTEVTKRVADCRIVIMTLGLSELWFDTHTQTYLYLTPPRMFVARFPDRFELHLLSFEETIRSLKSVIALLRSHCREDQRILLTVSPVPMRYTHTARDVLVVNCYSKSLLRTAAEHVAGAFAHVDYFPSYESVTLSDRAHAWMDDQIHVRIALITLNVDRMLKAYTRGSATAPTIDVRRRLREAEDEIEVGNFSSALDLLEPLRRAQQLEPDQALGYAGLCIRLHRLEDAQGAIAKLPPSAEDWRRELISACIAIGKHDLDEGFSRLNRLLDQFPKKQPILRALAEAYAEAGSKENALVALRRWSDIFPNRPEPHRRAALIHKNSGDPDAAERAFRACLGAGSARAGHVLDYVEFLISQNRLSDAARELEHIQPESKAINKRMEQLRSFLPSVRADLSSD